jgi:hypothetical protein
MEERSNQTNFSNESAGGPINDILDRKKPDFGAMEQLPCPIIPEGEKPDPDEPGQHPVGVIPEGDRPVFVETEQPIIPKEEKPELDEIFSNVEDTMPSGIGVVSDLKTVAEITQNKWDLQFPDHAIPGPLKRFADTYTKEFEAPYQYWIFSAATVIGHLLCRRIKLNTSLTIEPRLYCVCTGPSGWGRKSEAGRQTVHHFRRYFKRFWGDEQHYDENGSVQPSQYLNIGRGFGSAEGLRDWLKVCPSTLILYDELKALIDKAGIPNSALAATLSTLFEQTSDANATKGKLVVVDDAHLSILAFCTDKLWESMFKSEIEAIGLLNRIWLVPGEPSGRKENPLIKPIDELKIFREWTKVLEMFPQCDTANQFHDSRKALLFTPEAHEIWKAWYCNEKAFVMDEYTSRLDSYGKKLLMIWSCLQNKDHINAETVQHVLALVRWQENVRRVFQPIITDNRQALLENRIVRKLKEKGPSLRKRDLLRGIHAERESTDFTEKVLKSMVGHERIKIYKDQDIKGRPYMVELLEEKE